MVKFVNKMEVLRCAVLLSVALTVSGNEVSVTSSNSALNVRLEDEADMICETDSPITFCIFSSSKGDTYPIAPGISYEDGRLAAIEGQKCGLRITNVKEQDAGAWKCSITSNSGQGAENGDHEITITVLKAPSSVNLDIGERLTVTPDQPEAKVKCTAEGGEPVPSFSWTLAGSPVDVAVLNEGEEGQGHFQEVQFKPRKEDNGKMLECVANSQAYRETDVTNGVNKAATTLDVQFAPTFPKDTYEFYGLTVGEPFDIKISFQLNPPPVSMEWIMHDGVRVPQGSESNDGKYTSTLSMNEDDSKPDLHTALLTINDVASKDGGSVSKLAVTNDHGTAEISFKLELGDKPAAEAGTGPVIAIVIIILLVIVVIAVAIVARSQKVLCFAARDGVNDPEKGKFSALDKEEDATPEKENKDILKNDPADSAPPPVADIKSSGGEPTPAAPSAETEEKKSNGAHSPAK